MLRTYPVWLALVLMFAGCSRAPVVTITNRSTNTLADVVVSGSGFSNWIGSIAVGRQSRLTVRPQGEAGLGISFGAGGQRVNAGDLAYIESRGGYRVEITIQPDLKVSASSNAKGY